MALDKLILYTSATAAARIGVSRQTLSRWEQEGKVPPVPPMPGDPSARGWSDLDIALVKNWLEGDFPHCDLAGHIARGRAMWADFYAKQAAKQAAGEQHFETCGRRATPQEARDSAANAARILAAIRAGRDLL